MLDIVNRCKFSGRARVRTRRVFGGWGQPPSRTWNTLIISGHDNNLGFYHQHGFYDDGTSVGYFGDEPEKPGKPKKRGGIRGSDANKDEKQCNYRLSPFYYDDEIMKKAVENLVASGEWTADKYNLWHHNCQDFCDAPQKEYYKLGGERKFRLKK